MPENIDEITFEDFYKKMGLKRYPFREKTAEREDREQLFVKPLNYSVLLDDLKSGSTTIVTGNRGTGKTMLLSDLKNKGKENV